IVDRIEFSKAGAIMEVYASLALPQTGTRLAFSGRVPLSARGGVAGNARVFLLGDHSVKVDNNMLLTLLGDERSYVEFDCNGFLGVNLDATLSISSDVLLPEDNEGRARNDRLTIGFTT